jgi:hypothetical protein
MAWTELTRRQHARVGDRYASDLTDAEWTLIEPLRGLMPEGAESYALMSVFMFPDTTRLPR